MPPPNEIVRQQSEAEAVAQLVRNSGDPHTIEVTGPDGAKAQVLAVPRMGGGFDIESVKDRLDEYRLTPERRIGTAQLFDLDSFVLHTNRFKDADSAIFANPSQTSPSLLSVLDYHRSLDKGEASPRFGEHRALYSFPISDEWQEWKSKNKSNVFTQAAFAEFLENRIVDVQDPANAGDAAKEYAATIGCTYASPSRLLELSRGLTVRIGSKHREARNLGTGETQFTFESVHQDESGAPLSVPGAFLIAIPFFRSGWSYQLPVRLRYRVRPEGVVWFYELARVDASFDHAFKQACDYAKEKTVLPIFSGSPESGE